MGSLPEPIIGGAKDVALLHSIPGIFPWPWAQAAPICKPENYQPVEMTFSPRFEITPPKIALPHYRGGAIPPTPHRGVVTVGGSPHRRGSNLQLLYDL